jgi:copper chaperone
MKSQIIVDHLTCGGCANTIAKALKTFPQVLDVKVDPEKDLVEVIHSSDISIGIIKEELKRLGYPERDTVKGLEKVKANVKSYVSCAIGKVTK